jgi:hypothetical protein
VFRRKFQALGLEIFVPFLELTVPQVSYGVNTCLTLIRRKLHRWNIEIPNKSIARARARDFSFYFRKATAKQPGLDEGLEEVCKRGSHLSRAQGTNFF